MNIVPYLQRLHYTGSLDPTLHLLQQLQEAHLLAIPFENLDIHYGIAIELDIEKLYSKIIVNRRGGFCYEVNGLFYELLVALGFNAKRISANVFDKTDGYGPPYDHLAVIVTIDGVDYLTDVGFGVFAFSPYSSDLTLEALLQGLGMPVRVEPFVVEEILEGRGHLEIGGLRMELAHVPGHSTDSVTFFLPDRGELFSGDTLMAQNLGRSDFPGGDEPLLIDGIREKLFALPENTQVFPGHGPPTTIGAERAGNPYCSD